jgi:hypothetical protein
VADLLVEAPQAACRETRLRFTHRFSMGAIKDRIATLALGCSSFALAMAPILLLFWLMQPKVLANPGISALSVAKAASWEPFLREPETPEAVEPPRRESAARLAQQQHQQYRETKREARASNRRPSRNANGRKSNKRYQRDWNPDSRMASSVA